MSLVAQTRQAFTGRIGEIIEAALGNDQLKQIFEAAEAGDADALARIEAAGATGQAPSGMLALKMGIVDKDTKNALLTAQAAEQTLLIMEEIERFYAEDYPVMEALARDASARADSSQETLLRSPREQVVNDYYAQKIKPAQKEIPSFKFIGSPGDPEHLVCAQATHQLAAEYEGNEKTGIKELLVSQWMKVPDCNPFGLDYVDGFKAHAAQSYRTSAAILRDKGYEDLAKGMEAVSDNVTCDPVQAQQHTPGRFSENLLFSQNRLIMTVNSLLDPCNVRDVPYVSMNEEWEQTIALRGRQSLKCA